MKKYTIAALALALSFCLTACGGNKNNNNTTNNTQTPSSTGATMLPETTDSMPTIETNIPDSHVDTGSPFEDDKMGSESTGTHHETGENGEANDSTGTGRARTRNRTMEPMR